MKVTVHEELHCFIIKPSGGFEEEDCQVLQDVLERSLHSLCRQVLIDLSNLQNITTSGQRLLLSFSSQLQAVHRPLVCYNINSAVLAAFEDSGLVKVIFTAQTLQEAPTMFLSHK